MSYDPNFDYSAPSIRSTACLGGAALAVHFYGSNRYTNYEIEIAEFNPPGNKIKGEWMPFAMKERWGQARPGDYTGTFESVAVPGNLVPIKSGKFYKVRVRAFDTYIEEFTAWSEATAAAQWVIPK